MWEGELNDSGDQEGEVVDEESAVEPAQPEVIAANSALAKQLHQRAEQPAAHAQTREQKELKRRRY